MTRLQLCQKVGRLLRSLTSLPGVGPTATTGQTGMELEIVSHVDDAYLSIQNRYQDWAFRRKQGTFNLSNGVRTYSRSTIVGSIADWERIFPMPSGTRKTLIHLTSTGVSDQSYCWFWLYDDWRGDYDRGTRPTGKPIRFTEQPSGTLEFDGTPDATYTVTTDYTRTPHTLAADSDEPIFDAAYHDVIVWDAVRQFSIIRAGGSELMRNADREFNRLLGLMEGRYRPELSWDGTQLWGRDP